MTTDRNNSSPESEGLIFEPGATARIHGSQPDIAMLLRMVAALTEEVNVLRTRLDTHERLAEAGHAPTPLAVESHVPSPEVVAERIAEGEALIARVMHSVVEDADGLLQDEQRIRALWQDSQRGDS
jgi:hypothetical protein